MKVIRRIGTARSTWSAAVVALLLAGAGTSGYVLSSAGSSKAPSAGGASAPPTPTITAEPSDPTLSSTATFAYSDSLPAAAFKCSLDGSAYADCGGRIVKPPNTGSITYTNLMPQRHCFQVEAVLAVLTSSPASYCWQQNGLPFTMSWTPPSTFYPATSHAANLVVTNPNPKAITIPKTGDTGGLTVVVSSNDPTHCPSSNFGLTQGLTVPAKVPAHTTGASLTSLGVPAADLPVVTMFDGIGGAGSHTNQDACQGVGLTFTFSAVASGI